MTRSVSGSTTTKVEIKDKQDTVCVFLRNTAVSGSFYLDNIHDVFGNTDTVSYYDADKRKPSAVTDPVGRAVTFTYDVQGRLTNVNTPCGTEEVSGDTVILYRSVSYTYDTDGYLTADAWS